MYAFIPNEHVFIILRTDCGFSSLACSSPWSCDRWCCNLDIPPESAIPACRKRRETHTPTQVQTVSERICETAVRSEDTFAEPRRKHAASDRSMNKTDASDSDKKNNYFNRFGELPLLLVNSSRACFIF